MREWMANKNQKAVFSLTFVVTKNINKKVIVQYSPTFYNSVKYYRLEINYFLRLSTKRSSFQIFLKPNNYIFFNNTK